MFSACRRSSLFMAMIVGLLMLALPACEQIANVTAIDPTQPDDDDRNDDPNDGDDPDDGTGDDDAEEPPATRYDVVYEILEEHCMGCHVAFEGLDELDWR